jgi:hypothetical protein
MTDRRMWEATPPTMLYFTCADGIRWENPHLGVADVAGRRDHNIVFASDMALKSPTALSYGPRSSSFPVRR